MRKNYEEKLVETALEIEQLDADAQTERIGDLAMDCDITRLHRLRNELTALLGGAVTHPEIRDVLPNCKEFLRSISSEDFYLLLSDAESTSDAIYIALWYHYGETMRHAIDQAALASKERMLLLYPLWRLYSDEARSYDGADDD